MTESNRLVGTSLAPEASAVTATLARMLAPIEEHPVTRQGRRVNAAAQAELSLTYAVDGQQATFVLQPGANDQAKLVNVGGNPGALLPGPLANDLLVMIGEEVNKRTRPRNGKKWDIDSNAARTFSFGLTDVLRRSRRGVSRESYAALVETATRLAKLRIVADRGAWRTEKGGRAYSRVVLGLIDRLEIKGRDENPAGARLELIISEDFARGLSESQRSLDSDLYWRIETSPARRLYRMLDLEWFRRRKASGGRHAEFRIPVHYLRDRIPIAETKTPHIIRTLDVWHAELVTAGFLEAPPMYRPTTGDDLLAYPTHPGRGAKLLSAVYRVQSAAVATRQKSRHGSRPPVPPSRETQHLLPLVPPLRYASDLADRMADLARDLPDTVRHVGLCKLAAEALTDAAAWHRCVSLARQESQGIAPVAKLIVEVRGELKRRGLPVPPRLLSREAQRELLQV